MLDKQKFFSVFLALSILSGLILEAAESAQPTKRNKIQPTLEAKAGYFFFSDSKMRKVYDEGGLDLQISGTYPIWRWLQIYASIEYLERHGKSLSGHQKTRIWGYPFSLGTGRCCHHS